MINLQLQNFKMKTNLYKLFIFFIAISVVSCSTEVDLNAPWKEQMVIYGLLDQSKSVQYINITKAYLGDGDALEMAKRGDSIYYNPADLTVTLEEMKGNDIVSTEILQPVSVYNKEAGIFNNDSAALYKAVNKLNSNNDYQLTVLNNKTGYKATAKTPLVKSDVGRNFTFNLYTTGTGVEESFNFVKANGAYIENKSIDWVVYENGKVYQPVIRFNYLEADNVAFTGAVAKYVDWFLPQERTEQNQLVNSEMEAIFGGEEFFKYLAAKIPADGKIRRAGKLEFTLNVGGEELDLYYQISKPSTGVSQEKPTYTNITNGFGIFSCRFQSPPQIVLIENVSLDKLINGELTAGLGFRP